MKLDIVGQQYFILFRFILKGFIPDRYFPLFSRFNLSTRVPYPSAPRDRPSIARLNHSRAGGMGDPCTRVFLKTTRDLYYLVVLVVVIRYEPDPPLLFLFRPEALSILVRVAILSSTLDRVVFAT